MGKPARQPTLPTILTTSAADTDEEFPKKMDIETTTVSERNVEFLDGTKYLEEYEMVYEHHPFC